MNHTTTSALAGLGAQATSQGTNQGGGASSQSGQIDPAVKAFEDYMKETPAQRFEDQWLAAHHLTAKDLEKMSPQQRAKILAEIQRDMKLQLEQKTLTKLQQLDPLL